MNSAASLPSYSRTLTSSGLVMCLKPCALMSNAKRESASDAVLWMVNKTTALTPSGVGLWIVGAAGAAVLPKAPYCTRCVAKVGRASLHRSSSRLGQWILTHPRNLISPYLYGFSALLLKMLQRVLVVPEGCTHVKRYPETTHNLRNCMKIIYMLRKF